jgi:pilus assembly protein CpaF
VISSLKKSPADPGLKARIAGLATRTQSSRTTATNVDQKPAIAPSPKPELVAKHSPLPPPESLATEALQKGKAALNRKDYGEATTWFRNAADQGNGDAQDNLGWLYENGWGVAKDYAEAMRWYRRAADQGNSNAQNNLGRLYRSGWGVAPDHSQAVNWFRKAADQGHAAAQVNLESKYGTTEAPIDGRPVIESIDDRMSAACWEMIGLLRAEVSPEQRAVLSRRQLAKIVSSSVDAYLAREGLNPGRYNRRDLVTIIIQGLLRSPVEELATSNTRRLRAVDAAKARILPLILERMDVAAAAELPRPAFEARLTEWVKELLVENKIQLNFTEQCALVELLLADMLGLGPLEPLLADDTVSDIMVNGPKQVYVERRGKLELTDATFRDEPHLMNICSKIVTRIGRRVDESHPLVDARLPDGSRVNIIISPLAIDGAMLSIRKFSNKAITLDMMAANGSISAAMATVLKIAARCRLNIIVSGGTGSGKTTLLNALSQLIDSAERIVTIEDAAELQLQQPHVGRLETRPATLEGTGEITIRDLLRNALRMRPDRIVIGECRGPEAFDMLQAMNTGHDGSMSTIHANSTRDALTRLENMIGMITNNLPLRSIRTQIASAVQLICQVNRMRDGERRVTQITELVGLEGDIITTHDLFTFKFQGEGSDGKLRGAFESSGIRPAFLPRAEYYGLDKTLLAAI